jgi:type IV secretory pathway TraG/TraD family ATPase VirD4
MRGYEQEVTVFAETDYRGKHMAFGIRRSDRAYHMAVIGRTGMGKTTMLETMIRADIESLARYGVVLLDPHGDLAENIVRNIPEERLGDLIYFNPAEESGSLGLNILEPVGNKPNLVVSGVISIFKKIWSDSWGPRMEHYFRHALATLIHIEGMTLLDVRGILQDKEFRAWVLRQIDDPVLHEFWEFEFARLTPSQHNEVVGPILNKVGAWSVDPQLRTVVGKKKSDINMAEVMNGKILVANISKGKLGEDASALLGSLLSTKLELSALARASIPVEERKDCYIYVDEFPTLATSSFTGMFSEARKYGVSITVAAQFIEQLDEPIRNSLFENVGTLIVFRVGPESARYLAPQFAPVFSKEDLMNIGRYEIYLRLMIDGVPSKAFSGRTISPRVQMMV